MSRYISAKGEYTNIAGYDFYRVRGVVGLYHYWGGERLSKDQIETRIALAPSMKFIVVDALDEMTL